MHSDAAAIHSIRPSGRGCLVALLIRGFADASIFAQAVSIIAAATVGLALAQSSGRTTR